jgi:hypothetical protein
LAGRHPFGVPALQGHHQGHHGRVERLPGHGLAEPGLHAVEFGVELCFGRVTVRGGMRFGQGPAEKGKVALQLCGGKGLRPEGEAEPSQQGQQVQSLFHGFVGFDRRWVRQNCYETRGRQMDRLPKGDFTVPKCNFPMP